MFWPIIILSILFVLGLLLRSFFSRLCAICFAVSLTWLYGFYAGWDVTVLAMLMGGSAVGLMYYLESRFPSGAGFFKLPYLVTAFALIYSVLSWSLDVTSLIALGGVWLIFIVIYLTRNEKGKDWFKKVVECCKNW